MPQPDQPRAWPADGLDRAPAIRRVTQALVAAAARLLGLRVSGLERIPERGPLLICGNHVSNLDGPVLMVAVGRRRFVRGLGKIELYRVPVLGWYLRRAGTIPLDRGRGDVGAMRAALDLLERGGCLAVFPEGTRSKTGLPGRARPGVSFLAARTGALVVPARILGTGRLAPGGLEVRFGEPLRFSGDPGDRAQCQAFADRVLERVFNL